MEIGKCWSCVNWGPRERREGESAKAMARARFLACRFGPAWEFKGPFASCGRFSVADDLDVRERWVLRHENARS